MKREYAMAGSGSETRQRPIILKARFSEQEATLVKQQADAASLSVSALIRFALLAQQPPRASHTPPLSRKDASEILARLGPIASDVRLIKDGGNPDKSLETLDAILRELGELRHGLFAALGRTP